jgi:Protein of unknown function (DUF4054)
LGVIVELNYGIWIGKYPEFAGAQPSPPAAAPAAFTASISGTTLDVTAITAGSLAAGYVLSGVGITPGTYVTELGSGTGGVGTYTVNNTQTVDAEEMSAATPYVSPTEFDNLAELAQAFLRNDGGGPVNDIQQQYLLLGLVVAHLAQLFCGSILGPATALVGQINTATEGSVSVGAVALTSLPWDAQWFAQTKYGFAFWQATRQFRTARYIPGPRRFFNPPVGPYGWGGGGRL